MEIERSIDVEDEVRIVLSPYVSAYCRPLPKDFTVPCVLVSQVGGADRNKVDMFDIVIDSRAKTEAEALELLRDSVGILRKKAADQTSVIRYVQVNSSGSWGSDPVRPDLSMCSARLRVVAHFENKNISKRNEEG